MGTNALENIKYIKENRVIKTKRTENACNWHIWKNYGYILFLIVATNSVSQNKVLYKDCIHNIRIRLIKVLIHSEFGVKMKIKMLIQGLAPVRWAKNYIKQQLVAFKEDTMV